MNMRALMIVIYGLGAVAAIFAPHGLLHSRPALIALLALCLANICWRLVIGKRRNGTSHERRLNAKSHQVSQPAPGLQEHVVSIPMEPVPGEDWV